MHDHPCHRRGFCFGYRSRDLLLFIGIHLSNILILALVLGWQIVLFILCLLVAILRLCEKEEERRYARDRKYYQAGRRRSTMPPRPYDRHGLGVFPKAANASRVLQSRQAKP